MQAKDVGLLTPQQFREENMEAGKADTGLPQKFTLKKKKFTLNQIGNFFVCFP